MDVSKYICLKCNVKFSSNRSLWNHNNKFHNKKNILPQKLKINKQIIYCEYCNKKCSRIDNRNRHYNICKSKKVLEENKLKEEILELKKENEKLQITNNNITTNNSNINNSNNNITNNITNNNNKIIINLNINKPGDENLKDLTEEEVIQILLKNGDGITKFIELINFNKELPQNHSFCTT